MARLRATPGVAARALEFLILTTTRTNEVIGCAREEIDWQARTWTIPAARMKSGKLHRVPLSPRALELLSGLDQEAGNKHVFIGRRAGAPLGIVAMYRVTKALNPAVTNHGFRSTFSDWAHEVSNFPNHVIELSLAHAVGTGVERAYRRGDLFDKRRKLMDAWARYCESTPVATSEVVPLRRARS